MKIHFHCHAISREEVRLAEHQFESIFRLYGDHVHRASLELRPVPKTSINWTITYWREFYHKGQVGDILIKFDPDTIIEAACPEIYYLETHSPRVLGQYDHDAGIWYGGFQVLNWTACAEMLGRVGKYNLGVWQDKATYLAMKEVPLMRAMPLRDVNLWGDEEYKPNKYRVWHPKKR